MHETQQHLVFVESMYIKKYFMISTYPMQPLTSLEQFEELLQHQSDFIIFKHSTRCCTSERAHQELTTAIDSLQLDHVYLVDVLSTGDLKHHIADKLEVAHHSPQALIVRGGKVLHHADHASISNGRLHQCLLGRHDTRNDIA